MALHATPTGQRGLQLALLAQLMALLIQIMELIGLPLVQTLVEAELHTIPLQRVVM